MFEIRKIKKDKWLIILLVGLLLVVIAMPVSDIKSDQTQDEQQVQKAENASGDTYTDALETRLENALAKIEPNTDGILSAFTIIIMTITNR